MHRGRKPVMENQMATKMECGMETLVSGLGRVFSAYHRSRVSRGAESQNVHS